MSAKQRILVLSAVLAVVLVAIGLFLYSMANTQSYNGVFVSGVRQVYQP